MTAAQAKKLFINEFYGTNKEYMKARRDDYCKVQFEWSCFMDSLCKSGEISLKIYNTAKF